MAEYIEREARYIDIKKATIPRGFFNQDLNVPKLFDWLESQPVADVAEVRHGEWIKKPHVSKEYKQCNVCKYDFSRLVPDNYCPNCGAKMDGKADKSNA